jgi:hypothetical protein
MYKHSRSLQDKKESHIPMCSIFYILNYFKGNKEVNIILKDEIYIANNNGRYQNTDLYRKEYNISFPISRQIGFICICVALDFL